MLPSPGAAAATDFAPSEMLAEHLHRSGNWHPPGLAAAGAPGESPDSGAVTSDHAMTLSPKVHVLTLEIWSKLGRI